MRNKIVLRLATLNDLDEIYQCNKRCLPITYGYHFYKRMISYPSCRTIIVQSHQGTVIGYLMGERDSKNNYHIMSIGVDEQYRRLGLGRLMINYIERAIKMSCNTMSLNVNVDNTTAIKFYSKNRFVIIKKLLGYYGSTYKNQSNDAYFMAKQIK